MTTKHSESEQNLDRFTENMGKIEALSQRLIAAMANKPATPTSLQGPNQELYSKAASAYMTEMVADPGKLIERQVSYWGEIMKNYAEAQTALTSGELSVPGQEAPKDRRFSNPLWESNPYFNLVKNQYLTSVDAIETAVTHIQGLEPDDQKRISFFAQQIVDMMAPSNFLGTNPDALNKALETEGQSLIDGLENLVGDLESSDGDLLVTLADKDAFRVGENLATSKGSVVFRNRMFELIQYAPTTEKVHKTPLIIFPPWINKFYILDLKEKNSLIRWIVDQGYTLFVVSWVNPDTSYKDVGIDTYVNEGYLTAIEQVKNITGEKQVNAVGYCIAGTTLGLTLALLKKRGDTSLKSATFFTTLTDFSDRGEVGVFLDNDFVDGIEKECIDKGVLPSHYMSRTFSYLRSNDLIYAPAIRSYMLGEAPPAFDLLFWNGDSTNLPARMAVEYLRGLCQDDKFARGEIELCGETLSLKDITVPVCAIACETDHIAAWKSSFNGLRQFGSRSKMFILAESGHIAGIVNPPSKKKYGHYQASGPLATDAETWKDGATFQPGSWWPHWEDWLAKRSGAKLEARQPGASLCDAPGEYVLVK